MTNRPARKSDHPTPTGRPRAVIYLRVSTRDQATRGGEAEGFSIPAQREACLRKAQALGADVTAEYVDAGESARSANRPQLQAMLQSVRTDPVDYVIVHKVDRLARNRVDDVEINVALTTAGAQLVSCSENIDETPSGMLLHGIMSSIAEFYSRNLATESKKGMRQKAKHGGTVGRAPFGYLNTRERDETGREKRIVIVDPDRHHWVPWLYERYATGEWTASMLASELQRLGVTTLPIPSRPAAPISTSHVNSILKNRYYLGYVKFEGIEYEGSHERLVSNELFETVQHVRQGRYQSREKPSIHTHYLKGAIACGACGELLALEVSRNRLGTHYWYFYCLGRQRLKNGCQFRAIQAHVVEQLIEDHWMTITHARDVIDTIRQIVWSHIERLLPSQGAKRADVERRLTALQYQSDKLMQAHYADAISLDDLKREQQRITTERGVLQMYLAQQQHNEDHLRERLQTCCALLASAHTHYLTANDQQRRDLNQGVFERIYIDDDEIVGSTLTPVFRQLLSDDLALSLRREAAPRTRSIDPPTAQEGLNPHPLTNSLLRRERPRGAMSWESKNPQPFQVGGSNVDFLVAATRIELVTLGL